MWAKLRDSSPCQPKPHCKPIPVMKTGFSLCSISNRENPVFITGIPATENRFFPVWKYYTGKSLFWPCTDPVRDCSASLHGFDANNQHQQSLKSYFLTSETDIFFQLLCGCTVSGLCSIHWPKKDSAFLNSVAFYSITNYVASWLKWLQMISYDSIWLHFTY